MTAKKVKWSPFTFNFQLALNTLEALNFLIIHWPKTESFYLIIITYLFVNFRLIMKAKAPRYWCKFISSKRRSIIRKHRWLWVINLQNRDVKNKDGRMRIKMWDWGDPFTLNKNINLSQFVYWKVMNTQNYIEQSKDVRGLEIRTKHMYFKLSTDRILFKICLD